MSMDTWRCFFCLQVDNPNLFFFNRLCSNVCGEMQRLISADVVTLFRFSPSVPGAPSPAGHLGAAGVRREAGQHGYPRPRGGVQHHALRVPLPRGVQNAKAAYSHTAWVAGCVRLDYLLSCVSGLRACGDAFAARLHRMVSGCLFWRLTHLSVCGFWWETREWLKAFILLFFLRCVLMPCDLLCGHYSWSFFMWTKYWKK